MDRNLLQRRRWYNDPRLWGALGLVMLVVLGFFIAACTGDLHASQPTATVAAPISPTATFPPTILVTPTETFLPPPTTIPLTWKRVWLGQEFARDTITAIAIDPKDPDVLYASMKSAGIYKSIDGGLSWRPAHHGLGNAHVGSLLIDPQNPQILYAGTMGGIFKTEDGGANWSRIGEGNYVLIDPQDSSHLYARDADNIYESTDQGKSWEVIYSSQKGCPGKMYSWAIHPENSQVLFIAAGIDCVAGIYATADGGHTWIPLRLLDRPQNYLLAQGEYRALSVELDRRGSYYFHWGYELIQNYSGIWRTLLQFLSPATFDSTGSVYFYCDTYLCKFNMDEKQRLRLGKPGVGVLSLIVISPHDPNTIYVAGEGIAVTKDGGQTWSKRSNGLGGMLLTLETGEGIPPILYLQQEEECNFINHVNDRNPLPGQPLYISNDGGLTWELATETGCYLIKDTREPTLYRMGMVQVPGWIWRSQDGGKSWVQVFTPHVPFTIAVQGGLMYFYWEDVLIEGKAYHWEYVSDDYGGEWRVVDPFMDAKLCYGSTLRFIDAYRPTAIDPSDGNHVFVIDNGRLLESHDSCDTTGPFVKAPNTSMNSIAFDPNKSSTFDAGTDSGAYSAIDGGQTWTEINNGLLDTTVVYSIVVDKVGNVYAATPHGIYRLEMSK